MSRRIVLDCAMEHWAFVSLRYKIHSKGWPCMQVLVNLRSECKSRQTGESKSAYRSMTTAQTERLPGLLSCHKNNSLCYCSLHGSACSQLAMTC